MARDWQELTELTRGEPFVVERVRLPAREAAIEGSFEVPPLARLAPKDQVFVMAFVRSHGSIKAMEAVFGISYPTVKRWLDRIGAALPLVESATHGTGADVLDDLEAGRISADEALERLG
ncbi:MAG: DUF2089 family protein [Planctomycetota bacterium]